METRHDKAIDFDSSDNVLVHQALAGDQAAFEALVSRYQRSLFHFIYRYLGEYHEAQDVLQQVVLLYYREYMNYAEIGQILKKPATTVKSRFHRAKPFLRAALTLQ